MKHFAARYLLSLLLLNLVACSSMSTVNLETTIQTDHARGVDYGSLVEVRTLDRRTVKFRVTDITEDGLGGKPGFFRYEEMQSLKVENPNSKSSDTFLNVVLGVLAVAALAALVANSDSVAICSPSPCPEPESR